MKRKRFKKRKSPWYNKKRGLRRSLLRSGGWIKSYNKNRPERKFIDAAALYPFAYDATPQLLNGCATGTFVNQRIGNKITMKSLFLRIDLINNYQDATGYDDINKNYRIIVLYDKQTNGALPAVSDILNLSTTSCTLAFNNLYNKDRFQILIDKTGSTLPISFVESVDHKSNTHKYIKIFKKLNHTVQFGTTGASITDIKTGSIIALFLSNESIASSLTTGTVSWRIRYIDP